MHRRVARLTFGVASILGCLLVGCKGGDGAQTASVEIPRCTDAPSLDSRAVRSWLRQEDFDSLEEYLRAFEAAAAHSGSCEYPLVWAYGPFLDAADWLEAPLDRWLEQRPESFEAHVARGVHWQGVGESRRGNRYTKDTPEENFAGMRQAFSRAIPDFFRAIELAPANPVPYYRAMAIAAWQGDDAAKRELLDRGLAARPGSYVLRDQYVGYLEPKWGGSFEEMERFAAEAQGSIELNPCLRWLLAKPPRARAAELVARGKLKQAVPLIEKTVELRGSFSDHEWLLDIYVRLDDHRRIIRTATRLLREFPEASVGYAKRAIAYAEIHQNERALADAERAVELAPLNFSRAVDRAWVIQKAVGIVASVPAYQRALELKPDNQWALDRLASIFSDIESRKGEAEPLLRKLTELSPRDPDVWLRHAALLRELADPRARSSYEQYLALADAADPRERIKIGFVTEMLARASDEDPPPEQRSPSTLPGLTELLSAR